MVPQPSVTLLLVSVSVTVTVGSQLSVAVTVGTSGMLSHSTVASAGTPTNTGSVLSCTVRVWLWEVVLPQLSVTLQVRTLVPQPSVTLLLASLSVPVTVGSQLSVAVTV